MLVRGTRVNSTETPKDLREDKEENLVTDGMSKWWELLKKIVKEILKRKNPG